MKQISEKINAKQSDLNIFLFYNYIEVVKIKL